MTKAPRLFVFLLLAGVLLACGTRRAAAYVDYTPSLGKIIRDSNQIVVVEIEKFDLEKRAIVFKTVEVLRGKYPDNTLKQQITDGSPPRPPRHILEWAATGRRAICFISRDACLTCIGQSWYQLHPAGDGWWRMSLDKPELALSYYGSVERLRLAIAQMLQRKEAVITTLAHGADNAGATFDVAFNRTLLPGACRVQRSRAGINMPNMICYASASPNYRIGPGAAGIEDIPGLIQQLRSSDPQARIEAADDLSTLGAAAGSAGPDLLTLFAAVDQKTALHAAAAYARVEPKNPAGVQRLIRSLDDPSAAIRKEAMNCIARAGPLAVGSADGLARRLAAETSADVRIAAIEALGLIGAEGAIDPLIRSLDDRTARCNAADALGQIGPAAQRALASLARGVESDDEAYQWAAVRAMVQIGGEGARPAVAFLIRELQAAPRGRNLYNISVYLGLLGPVAHDAIPALMAARQRDLELCAMALWAVEPEKKFPWQWGYAVDREIDRWLFEAYIREMKGRARPAATALAQSLVEQKAGWVPSWGFQLIIDYPEESLPILIKALKSEDSKVKVATLWALSQIGHAGEPAAGDVEALLKDEDESVRAFAARAMRSIRPESNPKNRPI